ncbi:cuticle protein 14-like [Ixodes scapularis]|uniref:cuticle protein 14-like n=1 Tax=Ixodes scapularis TaxID=6945 RepID=UPI001A9E5150|nr:cuticle protein 14-like [Ixodes scapularis]
MKVIILLAALAVAHAGFVGHAGFGYGHGGYGHGHGHVAVAKVAVAAESGHSSQHRSQDLKGNYNFGYKESHTSGGSFRQESGDAWGNKVGSFGLTDADGRVRVVKYVADGHGFRAHIATNEPGTAASHPAAASFSAPHKVPAVGLGVAKVAVAAAHPVASYAVAPVAYGHGYGHGGYGHGGYGHGGYGHGFGHGVVLGHGGYGHGFGHFGGYGHGFHG